MARSTLLAAGLLTAALTAGGAAGLILGTPSISGAQEGSTTTTEDGTTTPPDAETAPEEGIERAPEGCAEGGGGGRGVAPADEPATEAEDASTVPT